MQVPAFAGHAAHFVADKGGGVVDEDSDRAKRGTGAVQKRLDLFLALQIRLQNTAFAADPLQQGFGLAGAVTAVNGDRESLFRQHLHESRTDTARASRDECDTGTREGIRKGKTMVRGTDGP